MSSRLWQMLPHLLLLAFAGCTTNATPPTVPEVPTMPDPSSAAGALESFRWCWENRDAESYASLFTGDFTFQFSQLDSAGNAFRDHPWTREDELIATRNMFVGGSVGEPAADRITLDFTNELRAFPDNRPGKHPTWHKMFRIEVNLRVTRGQSTLEVRGPGLFFVVRGDSAAIPPELQAQGSTPDPNRWYIERWEDETVADQTGPGFRALPGKSVTWGSVKSLYR